ncbi:MAG: 16S rRNA (cytosine(1402)-N(4))-methyltransferase RsmH [Candidatus Parcubacteria bacterium]|nr:16S rRNA (cytosine(1402)-N(4))-methyltransferase RsmH [Candidatus Parcubacteria bacterium]
MTRHIPALLDEVLANLNPAPNQNFIDCTLGGGGHAKAILELIKPSGKLLGIDAAPEAIEAMRRATNNNHDWRKRLILVNDNFVNLKKIVQENNFTPLDNVISSHQAADKKNISSKLNKSLVPHGGNLTGFTDIGGILLDLGFSSDLLENSARGLSFQIDGPLDMRFNPRQQELTAAEIINSWPAADLENIFKDFGEERFARPIVKAIIASRKDKKIITTLQLAAVVQGTVGKNYIVKTLARIFQALRIAVNNELDNLSQVLPQAIDLLNKDGRLAVISFHSLEDRIVKNIFRTNPALKIITKKPITASESEMAVNPRARSAKLRVAQKI